MRVERFELLAKSLRPLPDKWHGLADPELRAVIVCPSNPFISIDPILAVPGMRATSLGEIEVKGKLERVDAYLLELRS